MLYTQLKNLKILRWYKKYVCTTTHTKCVCDPLHIQNAMKVKKNCLFKIPPHSELFQNKNITQTVNTHNLNADSFFRSEIYFNVKNCYKIVITKDISFTF